MCKKTTVCYSDEMIIEALCEETNKSKFFVEAALFYIKNKDCITSNVDSITRETVKEIAKDIVIDCLKGLVASGPITNPNYTQNVIAMDEDIMAIMDLDED